MNKVVLPPWAKPGMTVIRTWEAPFNSGGGSIKEQCAAYGTAKWVEYKDRQGNIQCCMIWVRWAEQYRGEKY